MQKLIAVDWDRDHHGFADDGDERLSGVLGENHPIHRLDVIIVARSMEHQMLIRQQPLMGMRHRRRMPVVRIAAMHVGERRLSEAEEQRKGSRDCRQSIQDPFQCMCSNADWSTRPSSGLSGMRQTDCKRTAFARLTGHADCHRMPEAVELLCREGAQASACNSVQWVTPS